MLVTLRPVSHLIRPGILALALAAALPASAQSPDPTGPATFVVLLGGTRVGTESVTVTRPGGQWMIVGNGIVNAPLEMSTMKFEARYGSNWEPQRMALEASLRGQPLAISTTFGPDSATNQLTQGGQPASSTHRMTPRAVVIPNNFFAAYDSLALRLGDVPVNGSIPLYIPPAGETSVIVSQITPRRVSLGERTLQIREYALAVMNQSGAIPLELWIDERGRLARLVMRTASLVVIRDDLANVMAREERMAVEGDEDVFIGAAGFSLGGTLTRPAGVTGRAPVVILASGPGPQDRDHLLYGIPMFSHLAQTLSRAGYMVVRYDARGVGRSGGRAESSRVDEYADDVVQVVNWLRRRNDVDRNRIAVLGYADSGPIALAAARRTDRIAAVALVNAPGTTGREFVLEQQQNALAGTKVAESERTNRLALQAQVLDAVVSGKGWEGISEELREQADTPWFRSWLLFNPADTIRRVDQPLLILHGALDTEVPPAHAAALERLGTARDRPASHTQVVIVPGVNHLMTPAQTGTVDEYSTLGDRAPAPDLTAALTDWLGRTLVSR